MKIAEVRRFALSLPGVTEEPHFKYSSFRVRGRIFATIPPEAGYLNIFVAEEDREIALATEPGLVEKLLWGGRVVGLRASLAKAKPKLVARLIEQAWLRKAPKSLVALRRESAKTGGE